MFWLAFALSSSLAAVSVAQDVPPSTYPKNYTGIPTGDYSPEWQSYFEVKDPLPNVTWTLPRNFAGSIGVNRADHPNDTLFFWGFEKENGSLTAQEGERADEPWMIWLNGGPGASSLLGFVTENGPLHVTDDWSIVPNNYSWDKLADAVWVDQPVGVGLATADGNGYIDDEDQMCKDFLEFLHNLVKVFPSLRTRPLYLTGESYAGVYIPYIAKSLFSSPEPPVKLRKFSIGDGAMGNEAVFEQLPVLSLIETYPQLINFDTDVYDYFKTQEHLCGLDLNLTYPQNGTFPTLKIYYDGGYNTSAGAPSRSAPTASSLFSTVADRYSQKIASGTFTQRELDAREEKRQDWKRDLSGRPNGTIDPWYGCYLYDVMVDYAVNYSFPWTFGGWDVFDIPDALNPEAPNDASIFLNDNQTRAALHAPTSVNWSATITYPFKSTYNYTNGTNEFGDPSVEPMTFLSELATNASLNNVSMVFYSGNDDPLSGHRGTEVTIQNTTFGGVQGFTRKPSTPWYNDDGEFAGIVHQERNITYGLFVGAGHLVPHSKPHNAFVFLREFVLGSNETGLVRGDRVLGGEESALKGDILPGGGAIYYGNGTTASSTVVASQTLSSWTGFLATATDVTSSYAAAPTASGGANDSAV